MVNTFDEQVTVKVSPETQANTQIKLKDKGFPMYKMEEHFGDLYITYTMKTPISLTEKEKELFKELAALRTNT